MYDRTALAAVETFERACKRSLGQRRGWSYRSYGLENTNTWGSFAACRSTDEAASQTSWDSELLELA